MSPILARSISCHSRGDVTAPNTQIGDENDKSTRTNRHNRQPPTAKRYPFTPVAKTVWK